MDGSVMAHKLRLGKRDLGDKSDEFTLEMLVLWINRGGHVQEAREHMGLERQEVSGLKV